MLTEDYIMRMISQALAVLLTALGFKRAGQLNQALQTIDQAIETLLGLNARLVDQLDDSSLLDMLTFLQKLDVDRLLVLADIYKERADIYTLNGQSELSLFAAQRSMRLYLETALASETNTDLELIHKIESLRRDLASSALPVETRLALLDYLERLLTSSDDFLARTGISRPELHAAFASLDSPDIH
jgi:hypothetical protein